MLLSVILLCSCSEHFNQESITLKKAIFKQLQNSQYALKQTDLIFSSHIEEIHSSFSEHNKNNKNNPSYSRINGIFQRANSISIFIDNQTDVLEKQKKHLLGQNNAGSDIELIPYESLIKKVYLKSFQPDNVLIDFRHKLSEVIGYQKESFDNIQYSTEKELIMFISEKLKNYSPRDEQAFITELFTISYTSKKLFYSDPKKQEVIDLLINIQAFQNHLSKLKNSWLKNTAYNFTNCSFGERNAQVIVNVIGETSDSADYKICLYGEANYSPLRITNFKNSTVLKHTPHYQIIRISKTDSLKFMEFFKAFE